MGLISKTTTSHVRHTYLYIFVLHDYGVKMHNFAFYGEHKQATTKFNFFFMNLDMDLGIPLQESRLHLTKYVSKNI